MAIPSITTNLPEGSVAYIFGSYLTCDNPRDLDVLVVYDATLCAPRTAYKAHRDFLCRLRNLSRLPVDSTLLTKAEERESGFIEDTGAVLLTIDLITANSPNRTYRYL
jgi:hypothetical protein